jgi:hypothetical protein
MWRASSSISILPRVSGISTRRPIQETGTETNGVHRDITFHVHRALMQPINFGNPYRQRLQVQLLDGEQPAWHGAKVLSSRSS